MSVRMAGRQQRRKLCIFDQSERLIVPLPLLVLDNAALVVEFLLRHRAQQMSHAVTFRSEEHTSELQSLMRLSYAVFCLKKKKNTPYTTLSILYIPTKK